MSKKILIVSLILYITSAVGSFVVFSYIGSPSVPSLTEESSSTESEDTLLSTLLDISPEDPRDQACPLNGKFFTKQEREAWEARRPLAVMIENHVDARPQSGLSDADIVFETIAEGGVTRFMGMYYCGVQANDTILAPIRSARTYFIDWASGFNLPLYVHVGGANLPGPADALGQLGEYGWNLENDINQFSVGYPTFVRNANRIRGKKVATEHTMETSTERLWAVGEEREWTNITPERRVGRTVVEAAPWEDAYTPWTFSDEDEEPGDVTSIAYEFWSGYSQFNVEWNYNAEKNTYTRVMGGEPHTDLNNDKQIEASTVIVMQTDEKGPIDELKHMLYDTITSPNESRSALIFSNGDVVQAKWRKDDREEQIQFLDSKGNDVPLEPGLIWISVIDESNDVEY